MEDNSQSPQDALYEAFGVDITPVVDVVRLPGETVVEQVHAEHPDIEERDYQIECLGALVWARQYGEHRALIHMATGLGKTTVAALDVRDFLQHSPDSRVLFVAHQNEILRQAYERFKYILGEDRSYGMFTGKNRQGKDADCVFASFQLLHISRDTFQPDDFDYIVVDEGHHGKATTYEPSLLYFEPKFLLGMTATPDRRDLKEIREIFGDEIYSKPLDEALSERLLARPDYHVILDNISELLLHNEGMQASQYQRLNRKLFIPRRDEEIASIITRKIENVEKPKVIVFCPSVEHADRMAGMLPNAAALHSGHGNTERHMLMDRFARDDLAVLTTVDLFNEGIDVPDANVVVFLRSTESEIIFQQQLGRGLRKIPGKDTVLILDFVASCDRLLMIDRVLGIHAENDNANLVLDKADDPDTLYGLDFAAIRSRNEIDVEISDFSETTRQVLELLRSIDRRASTLAPAPEGWMPITEAAVEADISPNAALRRVRNLGLAAMRYLTAGGLPVVHIHEDDVQAIQRNAPKGTRTLKDAAEVLGISYNSVLSRLGHLGLSVVRMKANDRWRFVRDEDVEKISQTLERPEGLLNFRQAGEILGLTPVTTERHARKIGLPIMTYYGDNGRPTSYIPTDSVEALREILTISGELMRVSEAAAELRISQQTVLSRANKLGITVTSVALGDSGRPTPVITWEDFQRIKDMSALPEGWVRFEEAARRLGIGRNTFITRVEELGIESVYKRVTQGPAAAHISPGDFERIAALYKAPEGWIPLRDVAATYDIPIQTLNHRVKKMGIATQKYHTPNNRPIPYVSAEDIEKLVANYKSRK